MARKFIISEEQYSTLMSEGIVPNNNTTTITAPIKDGETGQEAVGNAAKNFKQSTGKDVGDANVNIQPVKQQSGVQEGRIITKSQMIESRLNNLKKNSKTYTLKEFMNKLK